MNTLIYWDFETGDSDPATCYPLQIAACVLDAEDDDLPIMDNGIFISYMRPPISDDDIMDVNIIKDGALKVNGINREDIKNFPDEKVVWSNFVKFCLSFKRGGELPVACGWNIKDFDLVIANRLNEAHGTKRFFHETNFIDLMNLDWIFRQRDPNYQGKSFDSARRWFGLELREAERRHEAGTDVRQGCDLLRRYLQYIWRGAKKAKYFKNAFSKDEE